MNIPKAFYTRRVGEALESLALHVTSARNIAASLKPIKTAPLGLEVEEEPRPIITSISPRTADAFYLVEFTINGKNLTADSVQGFELFLEDDPSVVREASNLSPVTQAGVVTGFTGDVNLSTAPPGSYELRITDEDDTPHLPGLIVEIEADESGIRTPPKIKAQPQKSVSVDKDKSITLKAKATGTQPLSYQWLKDGKPIAGKTTQTLEIKAAKSKDEGNYSVVVANKAGIVVSAESRVTVTSKKTT